MRAGGVGGNAAAACAPRIGGCSARVKTAATSLGQGYQRLEQILADLETEN